MRPNLDVAVVGGGLGGLASATYLARAGRRVTVFERSAAAGGRAVSHEEGGFRLNLGPHALLCGGAGEAVLRELGVSFSGGKPASAGSLALRGGALHALPTGFFSLLGTRLFGASAKLEAARLLAALGKLDPEPLADVPARAWIDEHAQHPAVRQLVEALFRVATYAN